MQTKPVTVINALDGTLFQNIGRQPNSDVWVFSDQVQIDGNGNMISEDQHVYIFNECLQEKMPEQHAVSLPLDDGKCLEETAILLKEYYKEVKS